jgi:chemotaxis protein MotA
MKNRNMIIALSLAAIVAAALVISGDIAMFFNPLGLLLVVGGTLAGVFMAFPLRTIKDLQDQLGHVFKARVRSLDEVERLFVRLTQLRRDHGVRAMELAARRLGHPFLEMGVSLVADERTPNYIRDRLEQEFELFASRREAQRAVLTLMGRLAPAFGLAGTIIGLVRMLNAIQDPSEVTAGMSVALLTTFYGIILANLMVLPIERKFREITRAEAEELTLMTEGIMGLAAEENGAAISARLHSFRFSGMYSRPKAEPASEQEPSAHPRTPLAWLRQVRSGSRLAGSMGHDR